MTEWTGTCLETKQQLGAALDRVAELEAALKAADDALNNFNEMEAERIIQAALKGKDADA